MMNTRQVSKQATAATSAAGLAPKPVGLSVKRINRFEGGGNLRAFCDLEIGPFLVKGLRVVEGKNGLFVSMPQQQGKDGNWYDTVFPLTKEMREQVSQLVLGAYQSES